MWNMRERQVLAVLLHSASVTRFALAIASIIIVALSSATEAAEVHTIGARTVIVRPKFGGQILGYDIDRNGARGLLSEYVSLGNGKNLVATETFDQNTGKIVKVIAKENQTMDDYVTLGIFGGIGLDLFQHQVRQFHIENHFLTISPLDAGKFTGTWTPPIKKGYQLWSISASQGTPSVAAYQSSFDTSLTYVFSSNVENNTFGRLISLKSIIDGSLFFHPLIALDSKSNQAVLADSLGCPEQICVTWIALVDLAGGKISKFTDNLGVGIVDGLAVDPVTGIAVTTTLIDQGVEFYDLAKQTGFEVTIPNSGNALKAGLDVEFDPIHKVFLVEQYSSTGDPKNPQPRVYVYDEKGNVKKTINVQRLPVSPSLIALNPAKRIGFLPVIVEPEHEFLQIQSFAY
jgi:hypothetical protein